MNISVMRSLCVMKKHGPPPCRVDAVSLLRKLPTCDQRISHFRFIRSDDLSCGLNVRTGQERTERPRSDTVVSEKRLKRPRFLPSPGLLSDSVVPVGRADSVESALVRCDNTCAFFQLWRALETRDLNQHCINYSLNTWFKKHRFLAHFRTNISRKNS